jgi:hypothetical protein
MLTILFLLVAGAAGFVLLLLVIVVTAIKQEPQSQELTSQPPSAITAWVRLLLGVSVRRPKQHPVLDKDREEPCLSVGEPPRWPKGPAG